MAVLCQAKKGLSHQLKDLYSVPGCTEKASLAEASLLCVCVTLVVIRNEESNSEVPGNSSGSHFYMLFPGDNVHNGRW